MAATRANLDVHVSGSCQTGALGAQPAPHLGLTPGSERWQADEQKGILEALYASEKRLRESEQRLAMALEGGCDGIWEWDGSDGQLWYSEKTLETLGYSPGELGVNIETWEAKIHPDDRERTMSSFFGHVAGQTPVYESEYRVLGKDGRYTWILARGRAVERDDNRYAARIVGTILDISKRKEAEARIAYLAHHDVLTDLPNRLLFQEQLDHVLSRAERHGEKIALLWGDLDGFKSINDTLGHHIGDAVLAQVALRLRNACPGANIVGRLGGDEFAILQGEGGIESARSGNLAKRLIKAVSEPIVVGPHSVVVGLSFGIVVAPDHGTDADSLLQRADIALYHAKRYGRNSVLSFDASMDVAIENKRRTEADLRLGLWRGEFELHYQPCIQLRGGRIVGAEALLRWRHPKRGMVPPNNFIPLAEEIGLIHELGQWVLESACREAASWPEHMRVAVNVSPLQFEQEGFVEQVIQALSSSGLAPHRLELEVTETALMRDSERAIATLTQLREAGVRTALDDFGTGYSSLSQLRKLPLDRLKIDRSFVNDIEHPDVKCIVRAIVSLGRALNLSITAEGVETREQLAAMRRKGCTEVQGFYFSKPVPRMQFLKFIMQDRISICESSIATDKA